MKMQNSALDEINALCAQLGVNGFVVIHEIMDGDRCDALTAWVNAGGA